MVPLSKSCDDRLSTTSHNISSVYHGDITSSVSPPSKASQGVFPFAGMPCPVCGVICTKPPRGGRPNLYCSPEHRRLWAAWMVLQRELSDVKFLNQTARISWVSELISLANGVRQ